MNIPYIPKHNPAPWHSRLALNESERADLEESRYKLKVLVNGIFRYLDEQRQASDLALLKSACLPSFGKALAYGKQTRQYYTAHRVPSQFIVAVETFRDLESAEAHYATLTLA